MLWEVVESHFVEDPKYNDKIGLQGLDFNLSEKYEVRGGGR